MKTSDGAERVAQVVPAVEVGNIHKRFGDLEVLKGISMSAHKGDVISIIGASGSGKSTFLRCINLLELPSQGEIIVSGEAIRFKSGNDGNLHPADVKQVQRLRTKLGAAMAIRTVRGIGYRLEEGGA